ncbi:MAG: CDP-diacylglycerol--serine O-phosphatidyltransferase [Saprospiraceae bacterium]|nr:CDP-diacylglycerol--serine O-phosphatidyltransferase [Saprospiraceae bacterium]
MNKYIPSLITLTGLFCGFMAIARADYTISPLLILISFVCDGLDGFVARLLNTESEIGKQLDSLSDIVSFGVAPAYLYYLMAPDDSYICMAVPSLVVVAGAFRLARYNVMEKVNYFRGLPIPSAAFFFVGIVLAIDNENEMLINLFDNKTVYIITPILISYLMVTSKLKCLVQSQSLPHSGIIFSRSGCNIFFVCWIFYDWAALALTILFYVLLSIGYTFVYKAPSKA